MKKFVTGIAATVVFVAVGPAIAADVEPVVFPGPFTAPPTFSAIPVYNWTARMSASMAAPPGVVRIGPLCPT
jgi:hypothetical protein